MKYFVIVCLFFAVIGSYAQSGVGINTTNPAAKLDINGDVKYSGATINSDSNSVLVRGENNIVSQNVMPNFFGITGLVVPICGSNGVGGTGNFQVEVNNIMYSVSWEILLKSIGTQVYPLRGQSLQVRYEFTPPLPFVPDGFSLTAYNNSNYPDTFNISYDTDYTQDYIIVNISRTDITSTDENGSCWGGQFYFDMLIYRYSNQ